MIALECCCHGVRLQSTAAETWVWFVQMGADIGSELLVVPSTCSEASLSANEDSWNATVEMSSDWFWLKLFLCSGDCQEVEVSCLCKLGQNSFLSSSSIGDHLRFILFDILGVVDYNCMSHIRNSSLLVLLFLSVLFCCWRYVSLDNRNILMTCQSFVIGCIKDVLMEVW